MRSFLLSVLLVALTACDGGVTSDIDAGDTVDSGTVDGGEVAIDAGDLDDAGAIDASLIDGGAPGDGGPPAPACDFVDDLVRGCGADENCVVGVHQTDCCGNTIAIGMNHSERDRFDADEPLCRATYPACGCPSGPTVTDSGETAGDPASIQVACVSRGPAGICLTYVTSRPMDGV